MNVSHASVFLALLRGINVGGNNIIRMENLRACFEGIGYTGVTTYIQSGNVIFSTRQADKAKMAAKIEQGLGRTFGYESKVVLVSGPELEQIVSESPSGFGEDGRRYRYDVIFLRDPLTPQAAFEQVSTNPEVDEAHAGAHALYFRRLISRASQSHLGRLIRRPAYKQITIRNWNTTTKLLEMMRGLER